MEPKRSKKGWKNMKTYQQKNEFTIPKSAYYRTIYLIKDLPRLLEEADAIIGATPPETETPEIQRQRNLRATETQNLQYAAIMADIRDIQNAIIEAVPPDKRMAIMENILDGKAYPIDCDRRTYGRYKQKLVYILATKRHYI